MKKLSRILAVLLTLCMILSVIPTAFAGAWDRSVTIGGTELNVWFTKYGNTFTDCSAAHFTGTDDNGYGFAEGDIVTVSFLDQSLDLPVGTNYSDVDSGTPMIKINAEGYIELAINMGNFGSTYGLVNIVKGTDGVYTVTPKEGVTFPVAVSFELKEAQGYAAELAMHRLTRTNNRGDYADLSDAEFANFRQVTTTGMGDHLYRGSSPINPEIGRNTYADAALEEAGVTVIMNLADSEAIAKAYEGFDTSYYAKQNVTYLNLGVDFTAADFKAGLAEGLKFFAANEGTYYVHCTEGKDRAGFVNALLECLMGATAEEVVADYMVTYYNYYGVTTDDARYEPIAKSNIVKTLQTAFGVEDLYTADLAAEADAYVKEIGLSDTEAEALKANLASPAELTGVVIPDGADMLKYGHIDIDIPADEFLKTFALGDIVTVELEGYGKFNVPVCTSYDEVEAGEMLLRVVSGKSYVILAINYGQIAVQEGIVEKAPDGAETAYVVKEGVTFPINVKITEKATQLKGLVIPDGADMLKYGHIDIDIPADTFLETFALGDIVTVELEGYGKFDVPVCASYDEVEAGEMLLRVVSGKSYVILAINYGQIAVQEGIVEKAPDGAETAYVVKEGVTFPINVTISEKITQVKGLVIPDGADMLKYGHIDIDIPADEFLTEFALGDIVEIEIEGYGKFEAPVCASYDDVAAGEMLLRAVEGKTYLIFAINYGQIAVQEGLVELAPDGSATKYVVKEGVTFPINVTITKISSGSEGNLIGDLVRTDVRADYPELSDAQFANFRKVTTTGIVDGILYRSSSPINPEIGRNICADIAAKEAGVKTFINLADTEAEATAYPGYADSYYSAQNHIFLGLPVAFTTDTFKSGLAEGFRYIIKNEGPYLVHCTEGKDRAGLTAAILECLMGASYDEILNDYVETYRNYYSVEDGAQRALTDKEVEAIEKVILANLKLSFGVEITKETDLAAAAEAYMKSIGLTEDEIAALKIRLGGEQKNPFTDVKEGDWFYDYVLKMADKGVINGMTETTFEPNGELTRAQIATMLYRLAGEPEVEGECSFVDVAKGKWYTDAITWAEKNNVVNGVGGGKFDPDGKVTREQFVAMMYRLAGSPETEGDLSAFADAKTVSSWAEAAMKWAVENEIIGGSKIDGKLSIDPKGNATRAQAAKILCVFDELA